MTEPSYKINESAIALLYTLARGYIDKGSIAAARDLVESLRIFCDKTTAEINQASRLAK
jgi:hypothetical protein